MISTRIVGAVCGGLSIPFLAISTVHATSFVDSFQAQIYSGNIAAAADLAEAEVNNSPDEGTAQAALGVAQFFGTVEELIRSLHRYGLYNGAEGSSLLGMAGLPFLRLPVPDSPNPEPVSYPALRDVLHRFRDGLAAAESTLARTGARPVALQLDLARIGFDLDGDGASAPSESLMGVFQAVAGPVRTGSDANGLLVDFDSADVAWLQAYSHVLMGMADFLLAHDWEAAYDASFEGLFPDSFTPRTVLHDYTRNAEARMAELATKMPPQPDCRVWRPGGVLDSACQQAHADYDRNETVREMWALQSALSYGSIADLVAFVHLNHWPVVEPGRMASCLGHIESMVSLSRENWRRILAETDDSREWIPSPKQTGALANMVIDQPRVDGWMAFLDQFERVLKGESLLPHWRFAQGFNLRRIFLEPRTFDIVLLIQGSAMLPYLEDGPIADAATWERATEVFGGDFFSYFIWIN